MGKIKVVGVAGGGDKFRNEIVGNRKKKKRIKELEILRRKVLETKRKLREKTALPRIQSSKTFTKILNKFADRRQANDNEAQGFDDKGRNTRRKRMCNRLLPLRKPQAGIFANGSKGVEIKRENLLLNRSDRARFEGDLQKILCDGKRTSKESKSGDLKKASDRRLSTELIESEDRGCVENSNEKLGAKNLKSSPVEMRKSSKRKIQDFNNSDERMTKKLNLQIEVAKVAVRDMKIKSDEKKTAEKLTWKRSLFQDEEDDSKHCVCEPIAMEIRFSPRTVETNVKIDQEKSKIFLESAEVGLGTERLNSNYGKLGEMATIRYEELCALVCENNFDNCLREIPHIDPLKTVKKSLTDFYVNSCRQRFSQKKSSVDESISGVSIVTEESDSSQYSWAVKNARHYHGDNDLQRSKRDKVHHKNFEISENCSHNPAVRTKIHIPVTRERMNDKLAPNLLSLQNKSRNEIPVKNLWDKQRTCLDSYTSFEESSNCATNNSLGVNNCESPKASLRTEIAKIDLNLADKIRQTKVTVQKTLAGIPEDRKKIMLRYLRDQQLVKNQETVFTPELATIDRPFAEITDHRIPRCLENRLKRHDEGETNEEKKRKGELCLEKLNIEETRGIRKLGEDGYLGVKRKNVDQEILGDEKMKIGKQTERCQETTKRFVDDVHKKCEKYVPAILRKSRDRMLGKFPRSDSTEPPKFMQKKSQSSLGECLMENASKPRRSSSQFFIDVKKASEKNRDRVRALNLRLAKECEQKTITCNAIGDNNLKSLADRREVNMTNIFEKSPSIESLENLAAQTSRSSIYLNDRGKTEDRSLFFSKRQKFGADIGSNIADENLTKIFSPLFPKPRVEKDRCRRSILPNDKAEPKLIIIHENDRPQDRRIIGNGGATFLHTNYPRVVQGPSSGINPISIPSGLNNGRHQVPQAGAEILTYQNFDPRFKKPERINPVDLQPRVMYPDQRTVLKLGNDSTVYLEPATFNVVQNSRGEFHRPIGSIDGAGQTQRWVPLTFAEGNSNFDGNLQTTTQFSSDGIRVQGLILPRNEREIYFQNFSVDHPAQRFAEKMIQRQDYAAVLTQDQNFTYKYIPAGPFTCPLDGYERSQIDESGSNQRYHQPVVQPVYNVTGAYRPQEVSQSYFPSGP